MWFKIIGEQVEIHIVAKPHAQKTALISVTDKALYLSIHAKPQEGEANREIIRYLAALLRIPKTKITITRGANSRFKSLLLPLTSNVEHFLQNIAEFYK